MPGRFRDDDEDRRRKVSRDFPPLPPWIVRRLLREGEQIAWVHGPRSGEAVERCLTHIMLFIVASGLALVLLALGWAFAGKIANIPVAVFLGAGAVVLGSVLALGIANGHYTRLVVTTHRMVILQGHEVVRSWSIDRLPRSLVRYGMQTGDRDTEASRTVDLDALKSILGSTGDKTSSSNGIMALGKKVDWIRSREREDD